MNNRDKTALDVLECLHSQQCILDRPEKPRTVLAIEIFGDSNLKACTAYGRISNACSYLLELGWSVQGPTQTTFYLSPTHYALIQDAASYESLWSLIHKLEKCPSPDAVRLLLSDYVIETALEAVGA